MRDPHGLVLDLGDNDPVADDLKPLEAPLDGRGFRWIPELSEQNGDGSRIGRLCVPDRQIHGTTLWTPCSVKS